MNETNLAQHFTINLLIQYVYQQTTHLMKTVLFAASCIASYIGAMQMFDLYIIYIFIGAKVNHTGSKNAGRTTHPPAHLKFANYPSPSF